VGDENMMLSNLKFVRCKDDCPKSFTVLVESTRTRCLDCEYQRRKTKESKRWHKGKKEQAA
jgi:hypothetical protein